MEARTDQSITRLGRVALTGVDIGRVRLYLFSRQGTDRIAKRVMLSSEDTELTAEVFAAC